MDLFSLQRLLGHTSLEMVQVYALQTDGDLLVAHERAAPLNGYL
jgi:site-specific recombinase XerD